MRSFEECKKIFDALYMADCSGSSEKAWCVTAYRMKWLSVVVHLLYPEIKPHLHRYYLNDKREVMDGDWEIEDCGDFLLQSSLLNGEVPDYALCYMAHSPFWDISYDNTVIGTEEKGTSGQEELNASQFLKGRFGDILEELFIDDMDIIMERELMDVFELYSTNEVADDLCVIKSELFPYVKKEKMVAGEECKKKIEAVEKAYGIIAGWLGINEVHFSTTNAGYFFTTDESAEASEGLYGGYGALDFEPSIIICGELIEAALFEIHDLYPFLPEHIVKRRLNK